MKTTFAFMQTAPRRVQYDESVVDRFVKGVREWQSTMHHTTFEKIWCET